MSAVRDPVVLLRVAARDGDRELALALLRRFRRDRRVARRADQALQALPRAGGP